jgi:hypothetical protein
MDATNQGTLRVVYAVTTAMVGLPEGHQALVRHGTHWPADDPVVVAHPDLFSDDPRHGLYSTRPVAGDDPS